LNRETRCKTRKYTRHVQREFFGCR
jgi:hypothetical protein